MDKEQIIEEILSFEHHKVAEKLGLIEPCELDINDELLIDAVGLVDYLSRDESEESKKIVVTLSSILWTYQKTEWDGLKDFLVLVLTRIGYSPSSIMIDSGYDIDENQYSSMSSMIDEIAVTTSQLQHEVRIRNKTFLLTQFQKNIWEKIDSNSVLGISAPTSAGKSFVIALKAIDILTNDPGTVIYIVPTLSLVSQVSVDFRKLLTLFEMDAYEILNTYTGVYEDPKKIFVLTQEKAIGSFSQSYHPFSNVKLLVVDEIQNVERVGNEDDQRAKTLYDLMVEFRYTAEPNHIIISGPRIEKIGGLGESIFGREADEEESKSSPVASITYAISKTRTNYILKQYTDIRAQPLHLTISKYEHISGQGKVLYSEEFHAYLSKVIHYLGDDSKNIIFSPTAVQARKTAASLAKNRSNVDIKNLDMLVEYLQHTVHHDYPLCETLKKGVAYHHGKLPLHVRRVIEKAITDKIVTNVVCTTTLMQGVNLPAQNVIIRNPNLSIRAKNGVKPKLTHYEVANLRGRAGRLLKDFLGRTFVLDEDAFEVDADKQESLFEDTTKEVYTGYEKIYRDHEADIEQGLLGLKPPSENNKSYSFLLTYIRQTILRHKDQALNRLNAVGIQLEENRFNEIASQLFQLEVPVDICLRNRYWDPISLEYLFDNRNEFDLPLNAFDAQLPYKLSNVLHKLQELCPIYYKRYFNVYDVNDKQVVLSYCFNATRWLKEVPLRDILSGNYYDDPSNIEKAISSLQNKISYGLPMLLRPIYDIKSPDSSFLTFIESGAYKSVTKRLIEYNIPRETAIHLSDKYLSNLDVDSKGFDYEMKKILKHNYSELNYWIQAQLEVLI